VRATRCYAGVRKTALGNEFEGLFDKGRPFEGVWTSPGKIKTPYLAAADTVKQPASAEKSAPPPPHGRSQSDPYIVFALEMVCVTCSANLCGCDFS
jgi:hypothetical protein